MSFNRHPLRCHETQPLDCSLRQVAIEAMKVGGHGYVTKVDAAKELLKAIQSVRAGTSFMSQRIRDQGWTAET